MSGYIGTQPVPQATQTRQTFVATAAQTGFATGGYSVGYLDVFLNGVKLQDGVDYTATNGSDIVLTVGAALDDTLEVVAYTAFEVLDQTFTGTTTVADSGAAPLVANRTTSDGNINVFQKDGTTVGAIGTAAGTLVIDGPGNNVGLYFAGNAIIPRDAGANTNGVNDLGGTANRWKDLYLSGGVYLGGTGAANKLDDYEEGTWTPTVAGLTLNVDNGKYTKVGELVTCTFQINSTGITNGNAANIGGLPFVNSDRNLDGRSGGYLTYNASGTHFTLLFLSGNPVVTFRVSPTGLNATLTQVSGNIFWGTLIYRTAS